MTKIKVLIMVGSLVGLFSAVAHSAEIKGKHSVKHEKKAPKEDITILTFDGNEKADNGMPTIVDKGKL